MPGFCSILLPGVSRSGLSKGKEKKAMNFVSVTLVLAVNLNLRVVVSDY
jgi:hypothetical protein